MSSPQLLHIAIRKVLPRIFVISQVKFEQHSQKVQGEIELTHDSFSLILPRQHQKGVGVEGTPQPLRQGVSQKSLGL